MAVNNLIEQNLLFEKKSPENAQSGHVAFNL